jgi:hypothetical protein
MVKLSLVTYGRAEFTNDARYVVVCTRVSDGVTEGEPVRLDDTVVEDDGEKLSEMDFDMVALTLIVDDSDTL